MRQLKLFLEAVEGKKLLAGTTGTCAVLVLLFFLFVHQPLMASRAAEQEKQQQSEMLYRQVANFKNAHINESDPGQSLEVRKKQTDAHLPDALQQREFLQALQRIAAGNGVHITQVKPERLVEGEGFAYIPIALTVETDYFSLLDFLRELENMDRFVRITEFSVAQDKGKLRCEIKLSIYVSRLEKSD